MDLKLFKLFVTILSISTVIKADINDVKRAAIKRIETQVKNIKTLTDETVAEAEKREGNIKIIGKHEREYGDGLLDTTLFQMDKNAKSAYMMANLLGSSNDVFRCIEFRHREAKDETGKFYSDRFLKPGHEYETKAEQIQRDQIKIWKDDYYKAVDQYNKIYQSSVNEIQKSSSEMSINSVVKRFDETTEQMAKIVTNVLFNMNKIHIEILRILENLVSSLQQFSKSRIQKTSELINNCFPKKNVLFTFPDFLKK